MQLISKITVSAAALVLVSLHIFHPGVSLDAISITLLVIAAIPWLLKHARTIEVPGVIKIDLADVKSAAEKLEPVPAMIATFRTTSAKGESTAPSLSNEGSLEKTTYDLAALGESRDPNVTFVGFRYEIEKRVRALVKAKGILNERVSLDRMIRALTSAGVVDPAFAAGLIEMVEFGNSAAHGALVSEGSADVVARLGPVILRDLDKRLSELKGTE